MKIKVWHKLMIVLDIYVRGYEIILANGINNSTINSKD